MNITFMDIGSRLYKYKPTIRINSNNIVEDYVIMQENMNEYKPNCVYVAKPGDIPKSLNITSPLNILLITNASILPALTDNELINLIIINDYTETAMILNELYAIFHSEKRLLMASSKLLAALSQGCKLQELLDLGSELLSNPILLVDMSTSLLAYSGINESFDEPAWKSHIDNGYITQEYYKLYEKEAKLAYMNADKDAPILINSKLWKYRIILHKATYQKSILGFIEVLEYNRGFQSSDVEIIKLIGDAIGIVIQSSSYYSNFPKSTFDASYLNLLKNKKVNNEQIVELTKHLSIEPNDYLFLLCIDLKNVIEANSKILYLKNKSERMIPRNHAIIHNGLIILLLLRKEPHLIQPELEHISDFLPQNNLTAGISRSFQNLDQLYLQYGNALMSIEIGQQLNPNENLFVYDKYMPYHLLSHSAENADLSDMCTPELIDLIKHDKIKKTELTLSLYYFIINNLNIQKTSDILHVHYNTLKYRLQRIEELYHLDFNNEHIQLNLRLSFLILEFIHKMDFVSYMNTVIK